MNNKKIRKIRRKARVRAKIFGTAKRPRLVVFRSNDHIYGQVIDDSIGKTLVATSDLNLPSEEKTKLKGLQKSASVGHLLAQKIVKAGIKELVFDRAGYKYHGNIKSFVDAVRAAKIKI